MGYTTSRFLSQTLSYEAVNTRSADGNQDKTYVAAVSFACREETISERILDTEGVEVLATSLVFIDPTIFTTPDVYARYTLPSGEVVRLARAEAIKDIAAGGTIKHWEAYFTK